MVPPSTTLSPRLQGQPAALAHGSTLPLALALVDAALLAWLAIEGPTARGRLAELVWPHSEPEAARSALRQRLYKLRQTFAAPLVSGQQTLALADGVVHDLTAAGPPLDGVPMHIGDDFEAWLMHQRERRRAALREQRLQQLQAAEAQPGGRAAAPS